MLQALCPDAHSRSQAPFLTGQMFASQGALPNSRKLVPLHRRRNRHQPRGDTIKYALFLRMTLHGPEVCLTRECLRARERKRDWTLRLITYWRLASRPLERIHNGCTSDTSRAGCRPHKEMPQGPRTQASPSVTFDYTIATSSAAAGLITDCYHI